MQSEVVDFPSLLELKSNLVISPKTKNPSVLSGESAFEMEQVIQDIRQLFDLQTKLKAEEKEEERIMMMT